MLGRVFFGHYLLAGIVISLAAALGSFLLLQRVAEERLGVDGARRAVLYLAVFPMTLFLQAVYSESLYLLLAIGAFVLAERGRFAWAGVVTGLAILTRVRGSRCCRRLRCSPGVAATGSARSPRSRSPSRGGDLPLVLWQQIGDAWAFVHAQERWHRHLSAAGPLGGVWDALTKWVPPGADRQHAIAENVEALVVLVLLIALTVVVWRWFGAAYGLFAAVSIAIPLSLPSDRWPLLSMPRFGLVIFPIFLALAVIGGRPRVHTAIVAVSSMFLGVVIAQWALWQWVA